MVDKVILIVNLIFCQWLRTSGTTRSPGVMRKSTEWCGLRATRMATSLSELLPRTPARGDQRKAHGSYTYFPRRRGERSHCGTLGAVTWDLIELSQLQLVC